MTAHPSKYYDRVKIVSRACGGLAHFEVRKYVSMVEYENVTTLYQLYADEGKYVATDALSRVFCISRHKIMAILREHKAKRIRSGVGVPVKGYYTLEDGIRLDDRIY